MKSFLKKIVFNKLIIKIIFPWLIKLHNYCYQLISFFVVILHDGVHPKHQIINYHQFFLDNIEENEIVLDIGCGNGFLAYDISKQARQVFAIDISPQNILIANKKYQRSNLVFILGDAIVYDFGKKFDKIILSNVLEHISNRIDFLRQLHRFSENILLRVPLLTRDWLVIYKKEHNFEYRLDKTHYIEYDFDILQKELESANWRIKNYSIQFGEIWCCVVVNS